MPFVLFDDDSDSEELPKEGLTHGLATNKVPLVLWLQDPFRSFLELFNCEEVGDFDPRMPLQFPWKRLFLLLSLTIMLVFVCCGEQHSQEFGPSDRALQGRRKSRCDCLLTQSRCNPVFRRNTGECALQGQSPRIGCSGEGKACTRTHSWDPGSQRQAVADHAMRLRGGQQRVRRSTRISKKREFQDYIRAKQESPVKRPHVLPSTQHYAAQGTDSRAGEHGHARYILVR
jgi:hypothetical protein